jgi:glycosyltransferase involved in cell wall biosynthesis
VDPRLSRLHGAVEKCLAVLPAQAIAVSDYARDFLIEKKGLPRDRVTLIRNGVPLEEFRDSPPEAGSDLRAELGIPTDSLVVGIIGMLHENKGHRLFLEALALEVLREDLVAVIVGDGEMRAQLEAHTRKLGVDGRVRFLGHRKDMPAVLRMIDVWVSASLSETAPLSLLEAMAAGRAIVATDCGGPGEIIRDRENGLLVPISDTGALASAIEEMAEDERLRRQLGDQARQDSEQYDIRGRVYAIEELYLDVAGRSQEHASPPEAGPS